MSGLAASESTMSETPYTPASRNFVSGFVSRGCFATPSGVMIGLFSLPSGFTGTVVSPRLFWAPSSASVPPPSPPDLFPLPKRLRQRRLHHRARHQVPAHVDDRA